MSSKYLPVINEQDKFHDVDIPGRKSSSESLTSTLLENGEDMRPKMARESTISRRMWLGHTVLLSLSFLMFAMSYFTRLSTLRHVQQFSAYSPAAEAVEYQRVKFSNTQSNRSIYIGSGLEVDKAWRALSYDIGDQMISEKELEIIDMPKSHLKVKHPKTGVEGYRVGLEVFHQLHCINMLRKATHKDHYMKFGGDFVEGQDSQLRMHLDHCLEILRLNAQCNADVGLFTFYLLEGDPLPWPELDSWHQCRNFDKVVEWANENSVGSMEIQ